MHKWLYNLRNCLCTGIQLLFDTRLIGLFKSNMVLNAHFLLFTIGLNGNKCKIILHKFVICQQEATGKLTQIGLDLWTGLY